MTCSLEQELDRFLNNINSERLLRFLPENQQDESRQFLTIFKNESKVALELIQSDLDYDLRILEVGAGLCLFSLFLKQKGYEITALEPLAGGFGFFDTLKQKILDEYAHTGLLVLGKVAQQLDSRTDGQYDLIFSNNVIEHISELDSAFLGMRAVLKPGGKMIHGCPNYIVPYEPHFGLPVLSWFPKLTELFWSRRIEKKPELWKSLNFVTYFRIKNIARKLDCSVKFKPHLTYKSFDRLRNDKEFRLRHQQTMVGRCLRVLEASGALNLTKLLPPWCSTPMTFTLTVKK